MKRRRHSAFATQHGSALIISLLASAAMMILMTALITSRLAEQNNIAGAVRGSQAQLLAEAGVDHMLGRIAQSTPPGVLPLVPPPCTLAFDAPLYYCTEDHAFADGTFSVVADELPGVGQLRIRSRGTSTAGTTRTVEALVDIESRNPIADQYAFLTCQDLVLNGSSEIHDGDIYSGGALTISNGERVTNGDAQAYGDIFFLNNGSITGNVISDTATISGTPPNFFRAGGYASVPTGNSTLTLGTQVGELKYDVDVPDYCLTPLLDTIWITPTDFDDYEVAALVASPTPGCSLIVSPPPSPPPLGCSQTVNTVNSSNGFLFDEDVHHVVPAGGELQITGSPADFFSGTYFIDGDLRISGNYSGEATFVVKGDLLLVGNLDIMTASAESNHAFVINGDIDVTGNPVIDGAIYANGGISGSGNLTVNGSIVAMGPGSGTGNLEVNYVRPGDDADLPNKILVGFNIERWRLIASPF